MDSKTTQTHTSHRPRVEDDALVRGAGRFVADAPEPGQAYAYFVRSPHAFARIRGIDIDAAKAAPGRAGGAHRGRHGRGRRRQCRRAIAPLAGRGGSEARSCPTGRRSRASA